MKLKITNEGSNYLAKVFRITTLVPHPNANKLQSCIVDGNSVITGLDAKVGDLYIYFPLECALNQDYLSWSNSFNHPELNVDKTKKGFFNDSGRVKAVKLRGAKSEGYIIPVGHFIEWVNLKIDDSAVIDDFIENTYFDTIVEILICEKYTNKEALRKLHNMEKAEARKNRNAKRASKLVENQFRLSEDTAALKKNIHIVKPDDYISISYKMHGCNASMGKVLCKKNLTLWNKIGILLGFDITDSQYDSLWASRRVIKNSYYDDNNSQSYYSENVWEHIAKKYNNSIKNGVTLYGEIVGQLSSGAWIQSEYDYGTNPTESELYVYRMTYTNIDGDVFEFSTPQIIAYCAKYGLKTVPIFYYGKAKDLFPEISVNDHWNEELLKKLIEKYTEKPCFMCKNAVPEEGVVITIQGDFFQGYKLKSFSFLERESKELDKGEVNIEDIEGAVEQNGD